MSIIIKGIDMPSKDKSPLVITVWADGIVCCVDSGGGIEETTSAIQIPTPHGRLIDGDALDRYIEGKGFVIGYKAIDEQKVILESEE